MMLLANAPRSTDDIDIFWLEDEETLQEAVLATLDIRAQTGKETASEKPSCHLLDVKMARKRNGQRRQ